MLETAVELRELTPHLADRLRLGLAQPAEPALQVADRRRGADEAGLEPRGGRIQREGWIQAARAGLGVATVYRPAAEEEIKQGTLRALPVASRRGLFGLVYRADAYWTPLMTSFAEQIRRAAGARAGAHTARAS